MNHLWSPAPFNITQCLKDELQSDRQTLQTITSLPNVLVNLVSSYLETPTEPYPLCSEVWTQTYELHSVAFHVIVYTRNLSATYIGSPKFHQIVAVYEDGTRLIKNPMEIHQHLLVLKRKRVFGQWLYWLESSLAPGWVSLHTVEEFG